MIDDTKRREVAQRLREIRPCKSGHIEWGRIAQAIGLKEPAGWFGWEKFEPESVQHLADLIEPSCDRDTPQKAAEKMFGKMRHSTKEEADAYDAMLKSKSVEIHPVDRDALLALADDIDKQTDGSMFDAWLEDGHYIARRIREACGKVGR